MSRAVARASTVNNTKAFNTAVGSILQMAEDFCLTIVGNLITPGAKLGLTFQQPEDKQHWRINPDGRIHSKMKPNLVLDIKGKNVLMRTHESLLFPGYEESIVEEISG